MKGMVTYDMMEAIRNTNEWMGASARAFASYPVWGLVPHPMFKVMSAWGRVTERSFARMTIKPDWNISSVVTEDGRDHLVEEVVEMRHVLLATCCAFASAAARKNRAAYCSARRCRGITPPAALDRDSLLPDCEVWVTDWHNARDIPVSEGKFDIEDYTLYLTEFMRHLGPDTHVIAVCQPVPLALAATAYLAELEPESQPRTLTLIGGPVDPDAAPTEVTDFGERVTMGQLEHLAIQRVGFKCKGVGRLVYPGLMQLGGFISMNMERHAQPFSDKITAEANGEGGERDKHNRFYDEYLSVMDMTAEFYLSTVERIFKDREIARNAFVVDGHKVDIGKITNVAVKIVEGEKDDISAPGQCLAALPL